MQLKKTEFKNLPDYAQAAEDLIQKHMDAGLEEEQAETAAKVTLEHVGCNIEGRNTATPIAQKAYNYLVGHGSKLHREKIMDDPNFRVIREEAVFDYFPAGENWCGGTIGKNFRFEAKLFDKGSLFGINSGRVSKLWIGNPDTHDCIVNYDRGWDVEPPEEYKATFDSVMALLESAPKRFENG